MKRKIVLIVLFVGLLVGLGILLFRAYDYYVEPEFESIPIPSLEVVSAPASPEEQNGPRDVVTEMEYSDNVVGWIRIPGIPVDDALVQYTDNNWYLTHNEYDEYDVWGAFFVNSQNEFESVATLDRVTTIFGHANGHATSPRFAYLKLLRDPAYAMNCRTIEMWLGDELTTWEIFAVGEYPVEADYLRTNPDDEFFSEQVANIKQYSLHQYDCIAENSDNLLILSTCAGDNDEDYRFIVCAKRVILSN